MTVPQILPFLLIGVAIIGSVASFILTYDTVQLLQNVHYVPACNISPILSCGSIMKTAQANLLGIPNSVLGLMAFSMLLVFGIVLASGAKVARWVWLCAQGAATIGVLFMQYLFFQAVYSLNTICPWCFVIWMITIPTFWYITLYNLTERNIRLPAPSSTIVFLRHHHADILIVWYLVIIGILLQHFWYFWSSIL